MSIRPSPPAPSPPAPPAPPPSAPSRRQATLALALLVPVCLVYLWFPGDGDQTVFEVGARRMAEGAAYYRDFWDIKQPGIFWFFQAGLALGVGVVGPRLLEIAAVFLGGWVVWRLAVGWRLHPSVRVIAPALVLGSYVLLSHRAGVTQIEGLMNPLLVAVLALTWPSPPRGGAPRSALRWAAAGVAVGLIGVTKPLYLPIPAVLLLGAVLASHASPAVRTARLGAAVGGAAVPLAAMIVYFAGHDALQLAWDSTVHLPRETVEEVPLSQGWRRWKDLVIGPILPLALIALATARRRGTVVREVTLALTVLVALGLAWPQFPGQYRMLMLAAPCGLLAVVGADHLWRRVGRPGPGLVRRRAIVLGVAAVLSAPMLWGPQRLVANAGEIPSWGLGEDARNARDFVLLDEHHDLEVTPVQARIPRGAAVYAFGHPQIYELLDAYPAIAISGWDASSKPARVWAELDAQLTRARPEWIYVETGYLEHIHRRAPGTAAMLVTRYLPVTATPRGEWYRTGEPGHPCGIPCDNRLAEPRR